MQKGREKSERDSGRDITLSNECFLVRKRYRITSEFERAEGNPDVTQMFVRSVKSSQVVPLSDTDECNVPLKYRSFSLV